MLCDCCPACNMREYECAMRVLHLCGETDHGGLEEDELKLRRGTSAVEGRSLLVVAGVDLSVHLRILVETHDVLALPPANCSSVHAEQC